MISPPPWRTFAGPPSMVVYVESIGTIFDGRINTILGRNAMCNYVGWSADNSRVRVSGHIIKLVLVKNNALILRLCCSSLTKCSDTEEIDN